MPIIPNCSEQKFWQSLFAVLMVFLLTISFTAAGTGSAQANSKYAAFVYDAHRGKVLFSRNADARRYPASLTKIMTLYMVFDAIDRGTISLNTRMRVSKRAASMQPSKLYLKAGSTIRVKDAIFALITKSANDVAVVVAEHLGGTESKFARQMTRKARSIGMRSTVFKNASGLPNSGQYTTARDMARLGLSIRTSHPRSFRYFNTRSFKYGGRTYGNHNRLLGRVRGVNGVKTGYIRASGFNLVTNVESDGRHLVAVVMGGRSGASRNKHMTALISKHIRKASRKDYKQKISPLLVAERATPPLPAANPKALLLASAPKAAPKREPAPQPVVIATSVQNALPVEQGSRADQAIQPKIVSVQTIKVNENGQRVLTQAASPVTAYAAATNAQPEIITPAKSEGWKIQISASPSLAGAEKLLAEAAKKGAAVLSDALPYTEPVQAGSATLYRVRFAGFDDKSDARRACTYMKKKRYQCIAIN